MARQTNILETSPHIVEREHDLCPAHGHMNRVEPKNFIEKVEMSKVRVQFEMSDESAAEVETLARSANITKKDLFNNALTLLQWAIAEVRSGRIIASVDEKEMKLKEISMPLLSELARTKKAEAIANPR